MNVKIQNLGNSAYALVIDKPNTPSNSLPRLAMITNFFSSGQWSIEDVRLHHHGIPSPYFSVSAERYWVHQDVSSTKDIETLKRFIPAHQEFDSTEHAGARLFTWCTYDGLVVGAPDPNETRHNHAVYHTRKAALDYLKRAADFWTAFPYDASHPHIEQLASFVKLPNPHRQLNPTELLGLFHLVDLVGDANELVKEMLGHEPPSFATLLEKNSNLLKPTSNASRLTRR
jgi:hypothetical protein